LIPAEAIGAASERSGGSYLVRQFWAFYAELVSMKRRLGGQSASGPLAQPGAQPPQESEPEAAGKAALSAAQAVSRQLLGVLELQAIEAQRAGGRYALDINHEAQYIMAALADEKIPIQTIAPKFTGRFNKGVDYVGNVAQFDKEFNDDLSVISFAVKKYGLPEGLKLSVHSGSDKFSIYASIRRAVQKHNALFQRGDVLLGVIVRGRGARSDGKRSEGAERPHEHGSIH